MQGSPPIQALFLLIVLSLLGFAGTQYINMGNYAQSQATPPEASIPSDTVETEIEFVFSSPPLSYKLVRPSDSGGEDVVLLQSTQVTENPCYENVHLIAHKVSTYWLDVRWSEDPKENSHHSVQVTLSPSHGQSQRYAFFTSYRGLDETFDYGNGEESHD